MEDIWVRRGLDPFASVFGDAGTSWRSVGFPSRIRREDPFMRRTSSRFLYFDPSDLCSGAVIILAFYMRGIQLLELTTPSAFLRPRAITVHVINPFTLASRTNRCTTASTCLLCTKLASNRPNHCLSDH